MFYDKSGFCLQVGKALIHIRWLLHLLSAHSQPSQPVQCSLKFGTKKSEMASNFSETEWKVWETPEIVEKLLPFLDPESIFALARFHEKIPAILQGTFIWSQFIRRTSPFTDDRSELENVNQNKTQVSDIIFTCTLWSTTLLKLD